MPIKFNAVFAQFDIKPEQVRLLRHQDSRSARGRTPYELWRDDRPAFEFYQAGQSPKNFSGLKADYWASFVVTPRGETLLAGFYKSSYQGRNKEPRPWPHTEGFDAPETCDVYELILDEHLSDLSGRLVIDWGEGLRTWIQRADNQNKPVLEIRRSFKEPEFPGFTHFLKSLSELESLPTDWITALHSSRGVYLLTCPKTKEQYVGSATGADGFYGRWLSYTRDGHGGNIGLKSRDPSEYQVSIREVAGSAATMQNIIAMETLWKQKLQSREMGLNRN